MRAALRNGAAYSSVGLSADGEFNDRRRKAATRSQIVAAGRGTGPLSRAVQGGGRQSEMPRNVRFTPKSGHYRSANKCPLCAKSRHSVLRKRTPLFDHLVGKFEQRRRYLETEPLSGLDVDQKLKFGRLHNR